MNVHLSPNGFVWVGGLVALFLFLFVPGKASILPVGGCVSLQLLVDTRLPHLLLLGIISFPQSNSLLLATQEGGLPRKEEKDLSEGIWDSQIVGTDSKISGPTQRNVPPQKSLAATGETVPASPRWVGL